jgi:hypothetical protein
MSRIAVGFGVLALVGVLGFLARPAGVAQEPRGDAEQPFAGQFMTIVKRSNPDSSIDLEKVQVRKLDGRSYLVGTGADTPDNWQRGKVVWVAVDDISEVTTFASLEELRKAGQLPDAPGAADPAPKKNGQP